jgi:hypothetical protein
MSPKSWLCLTNALHGRKGGDTLSKSKSMPVSIKLARIHMVAVSDLGLPGVLATIDEMVLCGIAELLDIIYGGR